MTRSELIRAVAAEAGISQAEAARTLQATLTCIEHALARGERVVLSGFGTFEMRQRSPRRGVDPRSGASIAIAGTRTPGFTASRRLKAATHAKNGVELSPAE